MASHESIKQEFEKYSADKYKKWAKGKRETKTEKEEFDNYVKQVTGNKSAYIFYDESNETRRIELDSFIKDTSEIVSGTGYAVQVKNKNDYFQCKAGDVITLVYRNGCRDGYVTENLLPNIIPVVTGEFDKTDNYENLIYLKQPTVYYVDKNKKGGESGGGAKLPTFSAEVIRTTQVGPEEKAKANVVLNKTPSFDGTEHQTFRFSFDIPEGKRGETGPAGPAGTPSQGGGPTTKVPELEDAVLHTIKGEFGVNLLDYREMSRDTHFKVDNEEFYLDNPKLHASDPEMKKLTPYNRVYNTEGDRNYSITYEAELLESSDTALEGNNKLLALVDYFHLDGEHPTNLIKLEFPNNNKKIAKTTIQPTLNYSYLRFTMGGKSEKQKGRIKFKAWYGNIKPVGLRQEFEFLSMNGIDLIKNIHGTADEYQIGRWGDIILKKLSVCNLKDLEVVKVHDDESKSTITVKAPSNIWIPSYIDGLQNPTMKKRMQDNLMASNLCGIMESADTAERQQRPFFIQDLTKETIDLGNGKTKDELCFTILLASENKSKWNKHLAETQIIYPVCDPDEQIRIPVPFGGYKFIMNNGAVIETNKYGKVENYTYKEVRSIKGIKLSASPFGYPDMIIDADNISAVIPNPYEGYKKE